MEPSDLLIQVARVLENLRVDYRATGSMASIAYGESRFTNDIDLVVDLGLDKVEAFCAAFPAPDFYVSHDAARDAVQNHRMFNVIHIVSGIKVDVIIPPETEFERSRRDRQRLIEVTGGARLHFESPEDVILKKLAFYLRLTAVMSGCAWPSVAS